MAFQIQPERGASLKPLVEFGIFDNFPKSEKRCKLHDPTVAHSSSINISLE